MLLSLLTDLFGPWKCPINLNQVSPVHELMRHSVVRKFLRTIHENLGSILSQRFSLPSCSTDPFPFYLSLRRREGDRRRAPSGRELSNPLSVSPSQRGLIISSLKGSLFPYLFLQPNRYFKAFSSYSCLKFSCVHAIRQKINTSRCWGFN